MERTYTQYKRNKIMMKLLEETIQYSQHHPIPIARVRIEDDGTPKLFCYYFNHENNTWGYEVYSGPNYITGTMDKLSYSRNYKMGKKLPKKYEWVAEWLRERWDLEFGDRYTNKAFPKTTTERLGEIITNILV